MSGRARFTQVEDYPAAILHYSITPTVVPYSESAEKPTRVTWMIAVSNDTGKPQPCREIVFSFPSGEAGSDLVVDPASIEASPALGTTWSVTAAGDGSFLAIPQPSAGTLQPGDSIALFFAGAKVNELPGLSRVEVYETLDITRATRLDVTKVPPGLAITRFTANPVQAVPGEQVELRWSSTAASGATLSWAGQSQPVPVDGSTTIQIAETTTVTLTVSGQGPPVSQHLTVTAVRTRVLSLEAEPEVVAQGGPATLRWVIRHAARAVLDPGAIEVDPSAGSLVVRPSNTTQYLLTAKGPGSGNNDSRGAYVNVEPVRIDSFSASIDTIELRQAATLSWRTAWASRVELDGKLVATSGSLPVSPQCDTTYRLTAYGLAGPIWQELTVRVLPTSLLPVGSIQAFAGPLPPDLELLGWMLCDGRALEVAAHPCLFRAVGRSFGSTSEGYFNLPDLRGSFLRGVSGASGRDPGSDGRKPSAEGGAAGNLVGSRQPYGTAPPRNPYRVWFGKLDLVSGSNDAGCGARPAEWNGGSAAVRADGGGDRESRPMNKAVFFLIKYRLVTEAGELVTPPAGSILSFAGNAPLDPTRWLPCDGRAVARADWPALVAAIGNSHGEQDQDHILLPDYRGYFLRGVDQHTGRDPDAAGRPPPHPTGAPGRQGNQGDHVGSAQSWATGLAHNALTTTFSHLPRSNSGQQVNGTLWDLAKVHDGSERVELTYQDGGDAETRPINMSVCWYIRVS